MLCRDDQVILTALLLYALEAALPMARGLPWWDSRGLAMLFLVHAGPVEFLYYWFHRALHHHYLYSRYHSHHHASIVTQPITGTHTLTLYNTFLFLKAMYQVQTNICMQSCKLLI
jgi:aldehyde decarbonylase